MKYELLDVIEVVDLSAPIDDKNLNYLRGGSCK